MFSGVQNGPVYTPDNIVCIAWGYIVWSGLYSGLFCRCMDVKCYHDMGC